MHRAVEKNMIDVIEIFHAAGGDLSMPNKNGFTTLHLAAKHGYLDMCKLLIAKG